MKVEDLAIDAQKTVGEKLVLTDVTEMREYVNGKRSEKISGYRYEVVMLERRMEKISVKISGEKRLERPETDFPRVELEGLTLKPVWTPNGYTVTATAENIRLSQTRAGKA